MGKRIFLLEDDHGIREVIELILELESYQVTSFETVEAFMMGNTNEVPDLFILDVMLPDGNGIQVCRELKSVGKNSPILMMSAHSTAFEVENACEAEAFIAKPFDINNLVETVKKLMMN